MYEKDDLRNKAEVPNRNYPPVQRPPEGNGHYASYYNKPVAPPPPALSSESAARARVRRRRVNGRRGVGDEWAWVVIAAALLGVVVIISLSVFVFLRAVQNDTDPAIAANFNQVLPTPVDARTDPNDTTGFITGQAVTLDDGRSIVLEPWDGTSRFTILMMGIDRRPGETGLQYRTDTMMLVSLDPVNNSIGLLSIPRDLFVAVPGYSQLQRVNSAMVLGELQQPGYGPSLAMQTVQYNLGIRIHDYMVVDFHAFITVVDAIGGIDIETTYTINDPYFPDMYYGYDPFYLPAGQHHLDGETALRFARTRHGDSDFQRAQRQQMVLQAIRSRVLDFDLLPGLIVQAPSLYGQLSNDVATQLTLDQLIQLVWYAKDISSDSINMGVIDERYTYPYTTPDGQQVLVPDRELIGPLMVEIFGESYSQ
jgi:polyisoprenyl-teichoic acid--peptidoglycan teichoic acid transferase